MERILRGDLRFSCGGFTYLRIAWRLYIKAERETSAHTGRRTSLGGLFCVPAMGLPIKIVYAIQASSTCRQVGCRVNDNNLATQRPFHPAAGTFLTGCGKKDLVILGASDKQALVPFQASTRSNCVRFTM